MCGENRFARNIMKILLSNDDGYNAEGLLRLALALKDRHEVHISAPAGEQSGSGHGLTFGRGLGWRRVPADELPEVDGKRIDVPCHAVYGSPADAVKFAIEHIYLGERFDLVISGVNTVLNIGSDIIYSGTFGAAEEGTILGVPSIALSTNVRKGGYDAAIDFIVRNLDEIYPLIPPLVTINVNVPFGNADDIKGVAVAPLGIRRYKDWYEPHDELFRLKGYPYDCSANEEEDDCVMSDRGYITITPVKIADTDFDCLEKLGAKEWKA